MEISITRALKELTLLEKRILSGIEDATFVSYAKKSSSKVLNTYTRDEFDKGCPHTCFFSCELGQLIFL